MKKGFLFVIFMLLLIYPLYAQIGQAGSIRGVVLDSEKNPLPGATITVSSPALMGTRSVVTAADGTYRFPPILPPGEYTITVELQGFNKIIRPGVVIRAGQTVDVNFEMQPSPVMEEVTVTAPSPVVDIVSPKVTQSVTPEVIETLPYSSRYYMTYATQTAAGVIGGSIHNEEPWDMAFKIDGVQANAPDQGMPNEAEIVTDSIEEIELVTGGMSVENYGSFSGYMNVITKSGGNKFHGSAQVYYTGEKLQQVLWTDEQLAALGLSKPGFPIYRWDTQATLGGPIIKDRLWFFGAFKYYAEEWHVYYIPVTIEGKYYGPYTSPDRMPQFFGKLTYQISNNLRAFSTINYANEKAPHYYTDWHLTASASANNHAVTLNSTTALTWMINPDNMADLRVGLYKFNWTGLYTKEADPSGPHYSDAYTGYEWGNRGMEAYTYKWTFDINLKYIHYQNDFLGGNHEFRAGIQYVHFRGDWGYWRQNPMDWTYYDGNPYYFRGLFGLSGPHPIYGDGLLGFAAYGTKRGESQMVGMGDRYAFFIQDQMTIKNRLTISLGFRYDRIIGSIPDQTKGAAGGTLAAAIGEYYIEPVFEFNPYKELSYKGLKNCYPYKAPAPVIGLTYDPFGKGKTALKLNYGHYYEQAPEGNWDWLQPNGPYMFSFYWWDLDENGQPDPPPIDQYQLTPGTDPSIMVRTVDWMEQIDPKLKTTYAREFIAGIEHELFPNTKVALRYIYRERKNVQDWLLYDKDTNKYWSQLEAAPEWWVPFTAIVPAYDIFPGKQVTVYYESNDAPLEFWRLTNVPRAKKRYQGVELSFEKRMHGGWYLGGNFNYSYQWDNGGFWTPNDRINAEGRRGTPWWVKLYGTFNVPYGFVLSFIYQHYEGGYWGRGVEIVAPDDWIIAHNVRSGWAWVQLEPPDCRRDQASDSMSFRIEKEFKIRNWGKVGIFVDIFNLIGKTYTWIGENPGGTWMPIAENTDEGEFIPDWAYKMVTGLSGTRSFRLSFRYRF